ncbi:hypothetical protein [Paenibacillus polymyxa]|uniref:hypothetical protein n=1 Tax=Paenibacillus polymyxa TaxID=1406 RepID=UPI002AB33EB0|nr:hypothetical protein [Paenibacillus polymyxa]MDY8021215.1 hypothetical protein [Paenibacillus polymyxa]
MIIDCTTFKGRMIWEYADGSFNVEGTHGKAYKNLRKAQRVAKYNYRNNIWI